MFFRTALTVAVFAAAALAVHFGATELQRRAEAAPAPAAAPIIPVSAKAIIQQDSYAITRSFVGQVEPQRQAAVSFELAGQLERIGVDEGDWVTEGQVLAHQDIALLEAERTRLLASKTATEAQLRFARQTVVRNEALNERGFASGASLDGALAQQDELAARIGEIDAALNTVAIRIGKSELRAPFAGRVTERLVDGGETLNPGQTVLQLVKLSNPQVRIGVPLGLAEASLETAEIAVNGQRYAATLVTLRPDIDPVTRTRTAIFEIPGLDQAAFGQTAELIVTQSIEAQGLWVPITTLKEGVRGQWTLLTVDATDTVRMAPVEVLHAESDRVYVRGAFPDGTRLIDEGPQRVTIGQQVAVTTVQP